MNCISFPDQLGNQLILTHPPQRVISLVPSQTELLFDLGIDQEIVGITKFCIYPQQWISRKTIVGGTKNFWFEVIDQLQPDLILGNKEENYKEGIEKLQAKYPVWMSDIYSFEDALNMIEAVGLIMQRSIQAKKLSTTIKENFESIYPVDPVKVLYLIWRKPWMAAGKNTFIDAMLEKIGLQNCIADQQRYPTLSASEITSLNADCILLSSEPFPFEEKHMTELQTISPFSKIILVDGKMFSWYGSRLKKAPEYFNSLKF